MKTENLYCHRCGKPLETVTVDTEFAESAYYVFRCPNCGAEYEVIEPEDKSEYPFYPEEDISMRVGDEGDHLMNDICLNCGHKVSIGNNFMLSDYDESIIDDDDDKMNFCLNTCPHCGISEIRWDNSENEKKDLPYWSEDNWLHEHLEGYDLNYLVHIWQKVNKAYDKDVVDKLKTFIKYHDAESDDNKKE